MRDSDLKDDNFGFNAETGEFGDMVKASVMDPAKVTRLALQNAASIVALMLTTEVLIADIKEDEEIAAVGGGPWRHGGGVLNRSSFIQPHRRVALQRVRTRRRCLPQGLSAKLGEGRSQISRDGPFVFREGPRGLARMSSRNSGFLE